MQLITSHVFQLNELGTECAAESLPAEARSAQTSAPRLRDRSTRSSTARPLADTSVARVRSPTVLPRLSSLPRHPHARGKPLQ